MCMATGLLQQVTRRVRLGERGARPGGRAGNSRRFLIFLPINSSGRNCGAGARSTSIVALAVAAMLTRCHVSPRRGFRVSERLDYVCTLAQFVTQFLQLFCTNSSAIFQAPTKKRESALTIFGPDRLATRPGAAQSTVWPPDYLAYAASTIMVRREAPPSSSEMVEATSGFVRHATLRKLRRGLWLC
jgi:hypothetical protein